MSLTRTTRHLFDSNFRSRQTLRIKDWQVEQLVLKRFQFLMRQLDGRNSQFSELT